MEPGILTHAYKTEAVIITVNVRVPALWLKRQGLQAKLAVMLETAGPASPAPEPRHCAYSRRSIKAPCPRPEIQWARTQSWSPGTTLGGQEGTPAGLAPGPPSGRSPPCRQALPQLSAVFVVVFVCFWPHSLRGLSSLTGSTLRPLPGKHGALPLGHQGGAVSLDSRSHPRSLPSGASAHTGVMMFALLLQIGVCESVSPPPAALTLRTQRTPSLTFGEHAC